MDDTTSADVTRPLQPPIFVLGMLLRSGTNYLHDLLSLHPDCSPSGVPEDFVLSNAPLLLRFVSSLYHTWEPTWNASERLGAPAALHELLGNALVQFLSGCRAEPTTSPTRTPARPRPSSARLLTRTPSIENVEHIYSFFPSAQLLIIVRDGRALVESGVLSFGWRYDDAMRAWDTAARSILAFQRECPRAVRQSRVVKYEDIVTDPRGELVQILRFLNLDLDRYDFDAALQLPVRGSSAFGRPMGEPVHWQPVARDPSFNPLERAAHWDHRRLSLFDHIAGASSLALGYGRDGTSEHASLSERLQQRLCRVRWLWRTAVRPRISLVARAARKPVPDLYDFMTAYLAQPRSHFDHRFLE